MLDVRKAALQERAPGAREGLVPAHAPWTVPEAEEEVNGMKANVSGVTVERVDGGFRVCGMIVVNSKYFGDDGKAGKAVYPVCVMVPDSGIRKALQDVPAELHRFAKRVKGWIE